MPRPTRQPSRTEVSPEDLEAFDAVVARAADPDRTLFVARQQTGAGSGPPRSTEEDAGYYGRLLLSPQMAYHLSELGRLVRGAGDRGDSYAHWERELVDQVLSADLHTNVIQLHHIPDAVAAGLRIEAIKALRSGDESALNDEERELVAFVRGVLNGTLTDAAWAALEARRGERMPVDYAIFTLFLVATMRLQQAVGLPEPSDAEVDELIASLDDGSRPVDPFVNRAG